MPDSFERRELLRLHRQVRSQRDEESIQPIVCLSREAMACLFEIQFAEGSLDRRKALRAFDWIDAIERQLTVYRDDSEISQLNANGFEKPVVVEERLFDLIADCHRLWAETGGAFDVTAGPLVKAWGFKRREGRIPSEGEIEEAKEKVGMQHLRLDPVKRSVELRLPGMEINFGSIGKGYALDRVAEWLREQEATSVLLGAGQSSVLAIGSRPGEQGWPIDLRHPADSSRTLATLHLADQGLSTSGTAEQFFEHQGRRYGHILDPRSGSPVEGMLQVAVVAPTAARAEALSTAFFVLGVDWAKDYCRRNPEIGAMLVSEKDQEQSVEINVLGSMEAEIRSN